MKKGKIDALKAEYKKLQKEVVKARKNDEEVVTETPEVEITPAMLAYNAERGKYLEMKKTEPKRKTTNREAQTLAMLAKFKERLESVSQTASTSSNLGENQEEEAEGKEEGAEEAKPEKMDLDAEDIEGDDWLAHKFEFGAEEIRRAKDANVKNEDMYDIFDPRNPMVKRRREESKRKSRHKKHSKS